MLSDRSDTGGQAAGEADEHELDRRGAVVLGREDLGVVGIEGELGPVFLLLAEAEVSLDGRVTVGAVLPLAGRTPLEPGALGRRGQCLTGAE